MIYSIEMLPHQFAELHKACQRVQDLLSLQQLLVFVSHLSHTDYSSVLKATATLIAHGYSVVPHLAVRNLQPNEAADQILTEMRHMGVRSILLLGGDKDKPAHFHSVESFLAATPAITRMKLEQVFFPTFPDGHLHTDETGALKQLKSKCDFALQHGLAPRLISQIAIDSETITQHQIKLSQWGIDAPLSLGCVASLSPGKMLKTARMIGLDRAFRFASQANLPRLIMSYDLDKFTAPLLATENLGGVHFYPFGNYDGALERLAGLAQGEHSRAYA